MEQQVIPFTSENAWLEARKQDITSTECAALFAASPYLTEFELFYAKSTGVPEVFTDNPRMRWGRRLQDPIAEGVAEDQGLHVQKMTEYIRAPSERLGASFDFRIIGADEKSPHFEQLAKHGSGIMEIKTVDPLVFKDEWLIIDGDAVEAPPHIEIQVQHQLLVSGLQWALIVALIGGNRVSVIPRAFDKNLGVAILKTAESFWALVDKGTPPAPDYARDSGRIARLYVESIAGKVLNAHDDTALAEWVKNYRTLGTSVSSIIKERDALRARILERIGDASRVLLPDCLLSAGTVKATTVPAYERAAYRNLRVSQIKEIA